MKANYIIMYSKTFWKTLEKLSQDERKMVFSKIRLLQDDPFYPSLRSKKLKGSSCYYEFSVNMNIRVLWRYDSGRVVVLIKVGGHDIIEDFVRNQP